MNDTMLSHLLSKVASAGIIAGVMVLAIFADTFTDEEKP